ncbi:MAG: GAF domain-containing protein [Woeseiaceae bacterium]
MTDGRDVDYGTLRAQLDALMKDEADPLANSANFVALVFNALPDINWLGIYVLRDAELVLGPFQGKPACVRIPMGQGVCGSAAEQMTTLRVSDVHEFDGHIVCDPESRSEIVVPLISEGRLYGVLDIDSPKPNRFGERDQESLEGLCELFVERLGLGSAAEFI